MSTSTNSFFYFLIDSREQKQAKDNEGMRLVRWKQIALYHTSFLKGHFRYFRWLKFYNSSGELWYLQIPGDKSSHHAINFPTHEIFIKNFNKEKAVGCENRSKMSKLAIDREPLLQLKRACLSQAIVQLIKEHRQCTRAHMSKIPM